MNAVRLDLNQRRLQKHNATSGVMFAQGHLYMSCPPVWRLLLLHECCDTCTLGTTSKTRCKGGETTDLDVDALRKNSHTCKSVHTHNFEGTVPLPLCGQQGAPRTL